MSDFTHINSKNHPTMVDVTAKKVTTRSATAQATVHMSDAIMAHIKDDDISTKKGPVFHTAILAGIMAAKKTSDLIPLCHPLALTKTNVDIAVSGPNTVLVTSMIMLQGKTGVEMEALTAASIAALTIYDMCKGFSHEITITDIKLLEKTGGKSDYKSK